MKIISLTAENIKKLRAVEIKPSGEIVTIAGKNGQGKTSVLDSIWWALTGTKNIQEQPIRKGESKARIKLDLGELVVERKFTSAGSTLTVESVDGARFPGPQKMLDALLGELSFDPLAFARMDPRKQFEELRRVSKLDVDIDKLNALNASDFAKRTDVNREAKAKRAQAGGMIVPQEVKAEHVDEGALVDELQKAGETNAEIERRRARRDTAKTEADTKRRAAALARERAAEMRAAADKLEKSATDLDDEATQIDKKIADAPALPEPIDVSTLRQKIEAARVTNEKLVERKRAVERRTTLEQEAKVLEDQSRDLTSSIAARDQAKSEAIRTATMPVAGLGFGDGHVTYNGIPFDQASSAEQLRVSMSIAIAANPKLRVIRITDGSLLDDESLAAISDMAKAEDFQVWLEKVDGSGKCGIVIEDGAVASTPESRAEVAAA